MFCLFGMWSGSLTDSPHVLIHLKRGGGGVNTMLGLHSHSVGNSLPNALVQGNDKRDRKKRYE